MFIGFNPEAARSEIRRFYAKAADALNVYKSAYDRLFGSDAGLHDAWCSPNAVKFSEIYIPKITSTLNMFCSELDNKYHAAVRSFNIVANRNNVSGYYGSNNLFVSLRIQPLLPKSPNGRVGIKPIEAQAAASAFISAMTHFDEVIDSIPSSISFHDESGEQARTYSVNISSIKSRIKSINMEIYNDIQKAIETEVHDDQLAKQQVVSTLNG